MCKAAAGAEPERREQRCQGGELCAGEEWTVVAPRACGPFLGPSQEGVIPRPEQNLAHIIKTSLHFAKSPSSKISKHCT